MHEPVSREQVKQRLRDMMSGHHYIVAGAQNDLLAHDAAQRAAREQDRQRMEALEAFRARVAAREKHMAEIVFQHIKHGDEKHQEWLRTELVNVLCREDTKACETFDHLQQCLAALEQQLATAQARCEQLENIDHRWTRKDIEELEREKAILTTALQQAKEWLKDFVEWNACNEQADGEYRCSQCLFKSDIGHAEDCGIVTARALLAALSAAELSKPVAKEMLTTEVDAALQQAKAGLAIMADEITNCPSDLYQQWLDDDVDMCFWRWMAQRTLADLSRPLANLSRPLADPAAETDTAPAAGPVDHLGDANKMVWTDATKEDGK